MNTSITEMNTSTTEPTAVQLAPSVIADDSERAPYLWPHWYAVYTCANHERRVADQFAYRGVEHFLPQYESVRRWRDRKVRLQIREFLDRGFRAEPHPYLTVGKRVRVSNGPLAGMEGILSRRKGKFRVVISIELVQRAVAVDVDAADVEPLT